MFYAIDEQHLSSGFTEGNYEFPSEARCTQDVNRCLSRETFLESEPEIGIEEYTILSSSQIYWNAMLESITSIEAFWNDSRSLRMICRPKE
jgi:hypothetical protein